MIPDGDLLFSSVYILLPEKSVRLLYLLIILNTCLQLPQPEVLFISRIQSTVQAFVILSCGCLMSVLLDGFTY